jgi:hypothetical protein
MNSRPKSSSAARVLWERQAQREIGLRVLASPRECRHMVKLDAVRFSATPSRVVGVAAAPFVALEDGAPDGSGDVSTAPARVQGLEPGVVSGLGLGLGLTLGPRLELGLGVGMGLDLGPDFKCLCGFELRGRAASVHGFSTGRGSAGGLLRPRRHGVRLSLEVRHQRAHRTELDLVEGSARCRVGE